MKAIYRGSRLMSTDFRATKLRFVMSTRTMIRLGLCALTHYAARDRARCSASNGLTSSGRNSRTCPLMVSSPVRSVALTYDSLRSRITNRLVWPN